MRKKGSHSFPPLQLFDFPSLTMDWNLANYHLSTNLSCKTPSSITQDPSGAYRDAQVQPTPPAHTHKGSSCCVGPPHRAQAMAQHLAPVQEMRSVQRWEPAQAACLLKASCLRFSRSLLVPRSQAHSTVCWCRHFYLVPSGPGPMQDSSEPRDFLDL